MIALLNQMALDVIGAPRNVEYVSASDAKHEATRTRTDLPALCDTAAFTFAKARGESKQSCYRRAAAADRACKITQREIRSMFYAVLGRLGNTKWLAREAEAAKRIRDL